MPSADLSAEQAMTWYMVGAAAHREQGRAAAHRDEASAPDVEQQRAADPAAVVAQQLDRAVLLEARMDGRRHTCSVSRFMISMPVRSPLWMVRSWRLAGERLLVDAAVGVPVEEAAVARLQLEHAAGRLLHERPRQLLVVDPAAAVQGVEQVGLERVAGAEHRVVAALDHAGAAGAAEQALHRHRDRQVRRVIGRVQGGAEPGAARAQDQDVGVEAVDRGLGGHEWERPRGYFAGAATRASSRARPAGPSHSRLPAARATSRPSRPITNVVGVAVTR